MCALDIHAQNGRPERFSRLIIEKTCAMKLSANLPHRFWREIIFTVIYLYNHILQAFNNWKLPYQAFYTYVFDKKKVSGPKKPFFHHFKAYSCKVYMKIKSKSDLQYLGKH